MKILRPYQTQAIKETWDALKKDDNPVLLMASVGAGKSLMLASILLTLQNQNKKALCLVNNAELVRNNCATFIEEGGKASIYCAALNSKDVTNTVIFGTPQSILNGINKNEPIAQIQFNIIVVDEAHAINFTNHRTTFMRILRHYKQEYPAMRLLGATGTNFRFRGNAIVGEGCLFKSQTGNITTEQLINDGYLIKPTFQIDKELVIDFSQVKLKKNGLFSQKELENVVEKNARLTELICHQVVHIMEEQKRRGVFFFATTKKHAEEIYGYLPPDQSAIILGDTPQHERTQILDKARHGEIKYLVNIAIISVGVDVPAFDTIAYLRPTESLVLLVQTMGRVLRLSPVTNKKESLVLDFAGNIERHRDWDNPLLSEAVAQTIDKDKPYVILCPACQSFNTEHARRCIGQINNKRCDYYFEFKECPNENCRVKNDIASRYCRECDTEIIDPNEKLNFNAIFESKKLAIVTNARYEIKDCSKGFVVKCSYYCMLDLNNETEIVEVFYCTSEKAMRVFYGQFIRKHCNESYKWFMRMNSKSHMMKMLHEAKTPSRLEIMNHTDGYIIKKKYFD